MGIIYFYPDNNYNYIVIYLQQPILIYRADSNLLNISLCSIIYNRLSPKTVEIDVLLH